MIVIYDKFATEYVGNGMGVLEPSECIVEEHANGMWAATMEYPISEDGKYKLLMDGCVVKMPVPVRDNPEGQALAPVTRSILAPSTAYRYVNLYRQATGNKRVKRYRTTAADARFIEIMTDGDRTFVITVDGGRKGWLDTSRMVYTGETVDDVPSGGASIPSGVIPTQQAEQCFRITSVDSDSDEMLVTVTMQHISYDALKYVTNNSSALKVNGNVATGTLVENIAAATEIGGIERGTVDHVHCDLTDLIIAGDFRRRNLVDCLLNEKDGIITQIGGELVRDNEDFYVLPDTKRDFGFTIRYAKNLQGVTMTTDSTNVVTRIIPFAKDKKSNWFNNTNKTSPDVNLTTVNSAYLGEYPEIMDEILETDVQVGKNGISSKSAAVTRITEIAQERFTKDRADLPAVTATVDFVDLGTSEEYAQYRRLQSIHIYDTVHIIHPLFAETLETRVIGYTFDVLSGSYRSIELGELYTKSGDLRTATMERLARDVQTAQESADNKVTSYIQATMPTDGADGDIWIDPSNGNRLHRYDETVGGWVDAQDGAIAIAQGTASSASETASSAIQTATLAQTAATTAQQTADSKSKQTTSATAPANPAVGDYWVNTSNGNALYRWDGTTWVMIPQRMAGDLADSVTDGIKQSALNGATYFQSNAQKFGLYNASDDSAIAEGGIDTDGKGYFAANRLRDPLNPNNGYVNLKAIDIGYGTGYEMHFMSPDFTGADSANPVPSGFTEGLRILVRNLPGSPNGVTLENDFLASIFTAGLLELPRVQLDEVTTQNKDNIPVALGSESSFDVSTSFYVMLDAANWSDNSYSYSFDYPCVKCDCTMLCTPAPEHLSSGVHLSGFTRHYELLETEPTEYDYYTGTWVSAFYPWEYYKLVGGEYVLGEDGDVWATNTWYDGTYAQTLEFACSGSAPSTNVKMNLVAISNNDIGDIGDA
jgi:phage minor structural protein